MNKDKIFEMIKITVNDILPDVDLEQITMDDSLKDIGANSVDRMDIIIDVMEKLDLKIPFMEFGELKNIREIVNLLAQKKGID